jgi:hypothetical protein
MIRAARLFAAAQGLAPYLNIAARSCLGVAPVPDFWRRRARCWKRGDMLRREKRAGR